VGRRDELSFIGGTLSVLRTRNSQLRSCADWEAEVVRPRPMHGAGARRSPTPLPQPRPGRQAIRPTHRLALALPLLHIPPRLATAVVFLWPQILQRCSRVEPSAVTPDSPRAAATTAATFRRRFRHTEHRPGPARSGVSSRSQSNGLPGGEKSLHGRHCGHSSLLRFNRVEPLLRAAACALAGSVQLAVA